MHWLPLIRSRKVASTAALGFQPGVHPELHLAAAGPHADGLLQVIDEVGHQPFVS
jgi:hypothetical protein